MAFFNGHNHTMYSNLRLLDCIIKPKDLIDRAIALGLSGVAITDHEALCSHIAVNQYAQKIKEQYPDFKIALGNEIYLTETREKGQAYPHFILIAKDAIGYKGLKELSSIAWYNLYWDRQMERVPVLKSELTSIMNKGYKNHIIATTACLGGELPKLILGKEMLEKAGEDVTEWNTNIDKFINYCIDTFGINNFFLETAPSTNIEQITVNRELYKYGKHYGIGVTVATDSHYLDKDTRFAHKAYLNSKGGEREIDSFYEFARLMDEKEVRELLGYSFNDSNIIDDIFNTTQTIQSMITDYSLAKPQEIPLVKVPESKPFYYDENNDWMAPYPVLRALQASDNEQERQWIIDCVAGLIDKKLERNRDYWNRLETEADVIKHISQQMGFCLFAYFNTFKHYIDLFWDCGSIVGPGRGSAVCFLSNYLLGITQLDPVAWGLEYWRFLNKDRLEMPDIDIDLAPSKRPKIFEEIRKERGELGLVQVATFGTEGTKSAIQTACRGYRQTDPITGEELFPEGIDVDISQYISSFIPSERGFLWSIKDAYYGNPDKGRAPISEFKKEIDNYPGLLSIILNIDGLVKQRGIHASGTVLYNDNFLDISSLMRAPSGDLITCWDLHDAEWAGNIKYDFLLTDISDKIIQCLALMSKDKTIDANMTLREQYDMYLHPEHMDTSKPEIWEALRKGSVLDVFQFSGGVGLATAKKVKPTNPIEMMNANALMRLMNEPGVESQMDRYIRIKTNGIDVFDAEMKHYNIPDNMRNALHKYCDKQYGCSLTQEQLMRVVMDKNIASFTLKEANAARKTVAKKKMSEIPALKEHFYSSMDKKYADYIWGLIIAPQLGYSFAEPHALAYSFVGLQSIVLATQFNPIYWNTACLIINSGSNEEVEGGSTNYGKIAKAIGDIRSKGINISLADINHSEFGFTPDIENSQIMFGLKGMLNVGDDIVREIIANRPYISPRDFLYKVNPNKQAMISLIKGGAFDKLMDRKLCMAWYIWETCDKKSRITLQNVNGLIARDLLPRTTPEEIMAKRVYEFNRYLKAKCKTNTVYYNLDTRAINFLTEIDCDSLINGNLTLTIKVWEKKYSAWMDIFRHWMTENQATILQQLNDTIFLEDWNKYALGNISSWEMEALCFYYHDHELKNVDNNRYGFSDFFKLPEEPIVEKTFGKGGKMFKLNRICGTCIAKDKIKSTVALLTTTGVVNVKFRKEYFSLFDKRISERSADGKHKVTKEKSWFDKGSMIIVQGIRSGDDFISKKYASSAMQHQLYKIDAVKSDGTLTIRTERYKGEAEDDE